jgi:hypothetical protein
LALLPFLQERIHDHREIETDQKSPHGVSFWCTVACEKVRRILREEDGTPYGSTNRLGLLRIIGADRPGNGGIR